MAKKEALLIIDMLNDFVLPDGSLSVPGAKKIIPVIKKEIEKFRRKNQPIFYINDSHSPADSEFLVWPEHCIADSKGAEVVKALAPRKGDYVICKQRYSAFFATNLDFLLKDLGIKKLILAGLLTNICIFFTAADAYMRGYQVSVLKNGVLALTNEEHQFSLEQMKKLLAAKLV